MQAGSIRVLLVEDDEDDYLITRDLLHQEEEQSFSLVWVDSLTKGMERVTDGIDAVLLDLSLPDSQGWDTFVSMHARAPRVPIILLTGFADEALGIRAVHEGAQDYLVKGHLDSYLLCRSIRYSIERKKTKEQLERVAEELREKNAQMEEDLGMAREIQQALLPREYPSFPGHATAEASALRFHHLYQPSAMVGGDFFDVLAISDSMAGLLICDVMGHGMRAALVTAIIRGLVEELRPVAADPGSFLTEINRGLFQILRRPDSLVFSSAAYVVADVATGMLRYASAGHPSPFRVRETGDVAPLVLDSDSRGPALGVTGNHAYAATQCDLQPQDLVVLFTDGLCEIEDADGREYGDTRLLDAVRERVSSPPDSLFEAILTDARAFSGQGDDGFEDDICLVGIEVVRLAGQPAAGAARE